MTMAKLFLGLLVIFRTAFAAILYSDVLQTFAPGDTVDLECDMPTSEALDYYYWLKMTVGQAPLYMVSTVMNSEPEFNRELKYNGRYKATKTGTKFVLSISKARMSDVGMYYCVTRQHYVPGLTFGRGVFLMHEGADSRTQHHLIQQPVSAPVKPGDNVTLTCTIHTEACAAEHSVYWFRHGSAESRPGLIYTQGVSGDQCEKIPEAGSSTQSCVYNLPKNNLSLSDAGTYYCAVASCGEILFGNGTKLDFESVCDCPMGTMVSLSILRTAVLLCCLAICAIIYVIKK